MEIGSSLLPSPFRTEEPPEARRLASLEAMVRNGSITPPGLAEYYELRAGHHARAGALARKDAELRPNGRLEPAEAAELLHLQAGIDPNFARIGGQFATTGSIPAQSVDRYLRTVSSAQPRSETEKVALGKLQEYVRRMKVDAKNGTLSRWENLTAKEVDAIEVKSAGQRVRDLGDDIARTTVSAPPTSAVRNLRAKEAPTERPWAPRNQQREERPAFPGAMLYIRG